MDINLNNDEIIIRRPHALKQNSNDIKKETKRCIGFDVIKKRHI